MPLLSKGLTAIACPRTSCGRVFVPMNEWAINPPGLTLVSSTRECKAETVPRNLVVPAWLENEFNKMDVICAYL